MRIIVTFMFFIFTKSVYAEMSNRDFRVELNALTTTIALVDRCNIQIDKNKFAKFVPEHFADKESALIAKMDNYVKVAKMNNKNISDLQLDLVCATIASYVAKHDLAP